MGKKRNGRNGGGGIPFYRVGIFTEELFNPGSLEDWNSEKKLYVVFYWSQIQTQ